MGSPVLRMQQQQQPLHPPVQNSFNVLDGHLSHFAGLNPNNPNNILGNVNNHGGPMVNNAAPPIIASFSNRPQQQPPPPAVHDPISNHGIVQGRSNPGGFGHHVPTPTLMGQQPPGQHNNLAGLSHQELTSNIASAANPMMFQNNRYGRI